MVMAPVLRTASVKPEMKLTMPDSDEADVSVILIL
jgi:hypothetical protein